MKMRNDTLHAGALDNTEFMSKSDALVRKHLWPRRILTFSGLHLGAVMADARPCTMVPSVAQIGPPVLGRRFEAFMQNLDSFTLLASFLGSVLQHTEKSVFVLTSPTQWEHA